MSDKLTSIELAAKVAEFVTIDGETVNINEDEAVRVALEEQGTSLKEVKSAQEAVTKATNAIAAAFGEKSVQVLADNKGVDDVQEKFNIGHQKVNLSMVRQATFPNPKDPANKIVKPCHLSVTRTLADGGTDLGRVRAHIAEIAKTCKLP